MLTKLLNVSYYNKRVRPVLKEDKPIIVKHGITLIDISNIVSIYRGYYTRRSEDMDFILIIIIIILLFCIRIRVGTIIQYWIRIKILQYYKCDINISKMRHFYINNYQGLIRYYPNADDYKIPFETAILKHKIF